VIDVVTGTYSGISPARARTELRLTHEAIRDLVGPEASKPAVVASAERVKAAAQLNELARGSPTRDLARHVRAVEIAHEQQARLEQRLRAHGHQQIIPLHDTNMPSMAT
jgi:hypothetical protein